jgi:hypothetical protein
MLLLFAGGCVKEHSSQILPNQSPSTFFWLFSDSTIASGISKQALHWWGEDRDGYVVGYLVALSPDLNQIPSPDTLTYTFTKRTDSLVSFPLRQANQNFLVAIRAVDNSLQYDLADGDKIKLSPSPYVDRNQNGIYDAGDLVLDKISESLDGVGARQVFPVKNSRPLISYAPDDADNSVFAQPPPITFTVASFSWIGSDPIDGDETIAGYLISLNDSTFAQPISVSRTITTATLAVPRARSDAAGSTVTADVLVGKSPNLKLIGSIPGLRLDAMNTLYVKTIDVAGAVSDPLKFPSLGRSWFVKKPRGKFLVVADYTNGDSLFARSYYHDSVFTKIGTGQFSNYDTLDIRVGSTTTRSFGSFVPALQHLNPALIKTLKLYNTVFWYSDGIPSLTAARYSLYDYTHSDDGGHLIFSTVFVTPVFNDAGGALTDIAPVDSFAQAPLSKTKFNGIVTPVSAAPDVFPQIAFKRTYSFFIFPIYRNTAAKNVYSLTDLAAPDPATVPVGVMDENKRIIFLGFPLHYMIADYPLGEGAIGFFTRAFNLFGLQ